MGEMLVLLFSFLLEFGLLRHTLEDSGFLVGVEDTI